ncbi:MAG TPA: magnesium transporter [Phycisphaerales bacterium]|nr:magnesium transporter [Phycisphaerales bacterium]HCD31426.1 magnesium transporter [Phycisphaerales bacterium]|tara:strand:+ start:32001 stop:33377 length:1377 start_codon:yes stop_codon:yes gene_type:complete
MSEDIELTIQPWDHLEELVDQQDREALRQFWRTLTSSELARAVSRMETDKQQLLVTLLDPDDAADLLEELPHIQAADILEELPAADAAAIVDELDSDEQVDVLNELDDDDAAAILEKMDPEEADDVRERVKYNPDTAGGLMITEYLSYPLNAKVMDVLADLRSHVEEYSEVDVRYIYVVDTIENELLQGVVRLKDLVLTPGHVDLMSISLQDVSSVSDVAGLDDLEHFFDREDFSAVPVVDQQGELLGTVLRSDVHEAVGERSDKKLMRFGGIITGEELRTMPTAVRAARRLMYLLPTLLLTALAASVISLFEDTIKEVTALAMFLPLVAGLSGCSGNQAVAVSMRELALGLAKPADLMRVFAKEASVGFAIGLVMGVLMFAMVLLWTGNTYVGIAVGVSIPLTVIVGAVVGGCIPLVLTGMKLDPAMASGPIVTTTVDFCAFFTVLKMTTAILAAVG